MLSSDPKIGTPNPALVEQQLRRLIASPGLHHAESLCLLLRYLASHALEKPHDHVKEYQIATDVFGRSETFDPRIDSTVRVQTSRLRNKLVEYYATTGKLDPLTIEIPRGAYTALFHLREEVRIADPPPPTAPPLHSEDQGTERHKPARRMWAVAIAALALGFAAGALIVSRSPRAAAPTSSDQPELRAFWSSVIRNPKPPLVVFSNAEFRGRPETGLRYFDARTDSRQHINDLYTGVGEVLAIAQLSEVFAWLHQEMVVKRSGLLSWDETRDRDLIFAGSPSENLSLRELPLSQEFVFRPMGAGDPRPGDLAIVNRHPRPGEPALFFASSALPLTEDYALVVLQPGLHPGQNVLLLAGTTTLGTQAAAEFVCQSDSVALIRNRLGIAPGEPYGPFSAVLRVRVARGVPVETSVVAVHSAVR
jgi:hypothetical protein